LNKPIDISRLAIAQAYACAQGWSISPGHHSHWGSPGSDNVLKVSSFFKDCRLSRRYLPPLFVTMQAR
jgi:hypothetical protein